MRKPTKAQEAEKAEAIKALKAMGVKPGARIYTKVTHVSRSGMSRSISLYIPTREVSGRGTEKHLGIQCIDHWAMTVLGEKFDSKNGGLKIGGAGMDMCFATVYHLGRVMFPKGGNVTKSTRRSQEEREGNKRETDGGYLLRKVDL